MCLTFYIITSTSPVHYSPCLYANSNIAPNLENLCTLLLKRLQTTQKPKDWKRIYGLKTLCLDNKSLNNLKKNYIGEKFVSNISF
uniref:Uncharacterized protein n=1 Tax=Romanomermis culicivorax TaxID=13658 RepID=A0A915KJK9_ROMCU